MDNQFIENDKSLEITAEHAVLIPTLPAIKSVMAYVEAVAVVIGSCHIHSVIEENENVKIYLNDKRFVDILVNNGVSILGRRMNVDYAVPRADKVILSNVDPIIPDAVLMKLLCFYGSPLSAIIHEKIATNSEYSHIECGKRKVYMKIQDDKKVPTKINFTYQDLCYQIDVLVEQCDSNDVCEPVMEDHEEDEINDLVEVESNQSLKPNINDLLLEKQPTPKQLAYRNRGKKNTQYSAELAARQIKRRARKGWYLSRKVKRGTKKHPGPKGSGPKRVLRNIPTSPKKLRVREPKDLGKPKRVKSVPQNNSIQDTDGKALDDVEITTDMNGFNEGVPNGGLQETFDTERVSQYPLTHEDLKEFITKTRFHREPMQVAFELLREHKTSDALEGLKNQLLEYYGTVKEQNLKLRIRRLVANLKSSKLVETIE